MHRRRRRAGLNPRQRDGGGYLRTTLLRRYNSTTGWGKSGEENKSKTKPSVIIDGHTAIAVQVY